MIGSGTSEHAADPNARVSIRWWWFIAVPLIGILVQTAYLCSNHIIERDGIFYLKGAEVWYKAGCFSAVPQTLISSRNTTAMQYYTAPFYLFILKTLKNLFPGASFESIARGWGMAAGGISILLIMLTAKLIFRDDLVALFAGCLLAVHPPFAKLAIAPLRDMTYLMLLAISVYLIVNVLIRRSWLCSALAGVIYFPGLICRAEFAALMAALVPLAVFDIIKIRKRSYRIWGALVAGCLLGYVLWTLLIGIPWDFLPVYFRRFIIH